MFWRVLDNVSLKISPNMHSYKCSFAETNFSLNVSLQLTLDIVRAEVITVEEHNTTETAKTYKVNCDRRNITGMENFTVQVLNASQVLTPSSEAHVYTLCKVCKKCATNLPNIYTSYHIQDSFINFSNASICIFFVCINLFVNQFCFISS